MKKCYLVLADGHIFEGKRFGAEGSALGELVFNTGMVGYETTLTDPNNYGQIVLQTFPMIGNYGIIPADLEGKKAHLSGYVVREYCTSPSNFRCEGTLDAYLKAQGIVGICDLDTREITRILRDKGVMNAKIVDDPADVEGLSDYEVNGAVEAVATHRRGTFPAGDPPTYRVSLLDLGNSGTIVSELLSRDCEVTIFPYTASATDIMSIGPDGIIVSDGPGDPRKNDAIVAQIKKMLGKVPVMGVGLGHQLMALAAGASCVKLPYGHRGANQPVKRLSDGRTYITAQNHGYAVDASTLPAGATLSAPQRR